MAAKTLKGKSVASNGSDGPTAVEKDNASSARKKEDLLVSTCKHANET